METETSFRGRDRLIAAGLALLAATVLLVVLALATSGSVRMFSVVVLGLLIPVVALATSAAERRRIGHRIAILETEVQSERAAGHRHDQRFARFTDELRAPLTAIYGLSRHLEDAGVADAAEAAELIGIISHDATEILRMVENTSAAAHIDTGTYRPKPTVVELDGYVARIIEGSSQPPNVTVVAVREALVWCDPAAIRLILLNVLHTAADGGANTARIDVDERNGLGILSITDDRHRSFMAETASGDLFGSGDTLSKSIVPALAESQGGTVSTVRMDGWSNTILRFPIATPAQLSSSTAPATAIGSPRTA